MQDFSYLLFFIFVLFLLYQFLKEVTNLLLTS
jgi:hypothetical protein